MLKQFQRGVLLTLPVALSAAVYGTVLGVIAAGKGVTALQLMLMNVTVFAGTAEFLMVEMWAMPVLQVVVAVFIINFRYLLIGASLTPLFNDTPLWKKALLIHLVADENWAVTMAEYQKGRGSVWFLFGGGVILILLWSIATLAGMGLGLFISDYERYAMDFVVIAVFTALAISLFRGKKDMIPFLIAAFSASVAQRFIGGKWYIVIGAVAGSIYAALSMKEEDSENGENDEP
jgi:predicted branched-subunit amino acid permease